MKNKINLKKGIIWRKTSEYRKSQPIKNKLTSKSVISFNGEQVNTEDQIFNPTKNKLNLEMGVTVGELCRML